MAQSYFNYNANQSTSLCWPDLILLALIVGTLFALGLGIPPLSVPDGARYSEIPREMIELGDYVTPHLNYIKYFEKPALFYWLQCAAIHLFGYNNWALRIPTAMMGVLGSCLTYLAGVKLFDRRTGWLSALILASSTLFFLMAHFVTLDMTVSVFLSATLFFFLFAMLAGEDTSERKFYAYAMYIASAAAVLTKGLIGILLPGMVFFIWIACLNRWRSLLRFCLPSGILLFLCITVPWHALVQSRHQEFFHFYFIEQQFHRYLTHYAGRYKGPWFFIPILIIGFHPWVGFLFGAIKEALPGKLKNWQHKSAELFCLIWFISFFIFFSISKSQLVPYLLPIFPAIALLTGNFLSNTWGDTFKPRTWSAGVYCYVIVSIIGAGILVLLPRKFPLADPYWGSISLWVIVSGLVLGALITSFCYHTGRRRATIISMAVSHFIILIFAFSALATMRDFSIKPLALWLKPRLSATDQVFSYKTYYQDLPVYLHRRIAIVGWRNELTFGLQHQADASNWMLDIPTFKQRWQHEQRIYALMERYEYDQLKAEGLKMFLLREANRQVLITNQRPTT